VELKMTDKKPHDLLGIVKIVSKEELMKEYPPPNQSDDEVRDQMANEYRKKSGDLFSATAFQIGWDAAMKHRGDK